MNSNTKTKTQWTIAIGAAFAWFGQHAGAGFSSGLNTLTYFSKAGYLSIIATLIPFIILGFTFYFIGEYAREIKAESYKDVALTLYSSNEKVGKIMLIFFDVIIMSSVLITSSTTLAGGGALMEQNLGWNYTLSTIVFLFIVVFLSMFGAKVLALANLPLGVGLIGSTAVISIVLITKNWDSISVNAP